MFNRISIIALGALFALGLSGPIAVHAATSPTLVGSSSYSVLGHTTVTNTGSTTTTGDVGVSTGTSITGFDNPGGPGFANGDNSTYVHSNDASAIAAQADNLSAFGALNQSCTRSYGAQDLTLISPLGPGVYCSSSAFSLSGNLTLTGTGTWIFKSVSTLITASSSTVTGGDACNVWWRVGSSATLGTNSTFLGNILALTSVGLNTGATLDGRAFAQTGAVTLDDNTISGPSCSGGGGGSVDASAIHVVKTASKTTLTSGPDKVTFTYKVTNTGDVALSDVSVKDDRCDDEEYVSGDENDDDMLDTDEEWKYTCKKTVKKTEINTVTAKGTANGEEVKATDTAKVTVSTPGLPATGVGPADESSIPWNSIIPISIFAILFSFYLARKKLAM